MDADHNLKETKRALLHLVDHHKVRQREIAELVGVTAQAVSHWCNGGNPTRRNEAKLNKAIEELEAKLKAS